MRIAYLDCFAGIAGDMFLGALLDAGVPADVMHDAVRAMDIGASLRIARVDRSGITSTKVDVLEHGQAVDVVAEKRNEAGPLEQSDSRQLSRLPGTQHMHKGGHHHHDHDHHHPHDSKTTNAHPHHHGRSLTEIRRLITSSTLDAQVKSTAIRAFELLGAAEAKIHNVPVDEIHFHEVGAVDAIVDIVAASAGIHALQVDAWYCSAVNVGSGTVDCAHGTFPVPAPATAELLLGLPTYAAHVQKELTTPTGAALLAALRPQCVTQPAMQVEKIGYGAGTRNPEGFPNVLRLSVGQSTAGISISDRSQAEGNATAAGPEEFVTVLEAAIDDASPQVLAFVAEEAIAGGALDVMLAPITMKKGRLGTLLTLLCDEQKALAMQELLLRETSTLGVRIRRDRRVTQQRKFVSVETPLGPVRIKVGSVDGQERNAMPEFEDCRQVAAAHSVPLKAVQDMAIAAYLRQ